MTYFRATTCDEALARLAERNPHDGRHRRIVCGATDCFAEAALVPAAFDWVDISRIEALRRIAHDGRTVRIGAAANWEDILATSWLPASLRQAAQGVGSRQIRVQGTLGGNLCHASPVADGMPPLLALDAQVELASARGGRRLPLLAFVTGPRDIALHPDELLVAIEFALPRDDARTAFIKCTNRDGSALAVVSAAVHVRVGDNSRIAEIAVVVGGASPVARRMHAIEAALMGQPIDALAAIVGSVESVASAPLPELAPIDDGRGTAAHRTALVRVAIARALTSCLEESDHGASFV